MERIHIKTAKKITFWFGKGFIILLMLITVLSGCTTRGNIQPAASHPVLPAGQSPSVSLLEDGQDGFVITEAAQLDEASRTDFEQAVAMFNEGSYDAAIELLKKVIARPTGVSAPYINLGMAYERIGDLDQAEVQFKAALDVFPGHPVACNQYGLLFRKTGRFDDARKIFEQALAEYPDYYHVHRNLGILYDLYLNDLERALAHYESYHLYVPEDDRVNMWIVDLRMQLGL